ncbi:hypothetical protein HMF3257_00390 [Spirosoma telluris]|uniref:Uncharacterized protein n=2 Tax=Spirosoma telluris TaxID=2183553 RepID=A0A327NH48_9BACT|nr:hypothetical protein HMF3257_00390 [Spirosoma telluris]
MEAIGKNTLATVDAIKLVADTLKLLQQQIQNSTTTQQTGLASMFSTLSNELHTDLIALQGTMKIELPNLGSDLREELALLRSTFAQNMLLLIKSFNVDITGLRDVSKAGFDALLNGIHIDLSNHGMTLHNDLTTLQEGVHADLSTLDQHVMASLLALAKAVHTDMAAMQLSNATQQALLRTDTKQNFTTLQTILKTELQTLQANSHTDLGVLTDTTQNELHTIQAILNNGRYEQDYQGTLLRVISEKNLSVSVQSFVNVWNQIDVVVDKSNLK